MRRWLTYFDVSYAARGLVMLRSLARWDPRAAITVLCLDARTRTILAAELPEVETVLEDDMRAYEPRLAAAQADRHRWEQMATTKPTFIAWALARATPDDEVAFVDADTMFFADPGPAFEVLARASVGLSAHRYGARVARNLEGAGRFNAGFLMFRGDACARTIVAGWREQCLAWCYDRRLGDGTGRFMNQGYLDGWPTLDARVAVIAHPGTNVALWNVERHRLALEPGRRPGVSPAAPDDGCRAARLTVDGAPLVFFHYSSMATDARGDWFSLHALPRRGAPLLLARVFAPYFAEVAAERARLLTRHGVEGMGTARRYDPARVTWLSGWKRRVPYLREARRLAEVIAARARVTTAPPRTSPARP